MNLRQSDPDVYPYIIRLFAAVTSACVMVESVARTNNPDTCTRIAAQADVIRSAADRARLAMLAARTAGGPRDAA